MTMDGIMNVVRSAGKVTRKEMAEVYAKAIQIEVGYIDWPILNRAIMDRWSRSGLRFIKERAWRIVEQAKRSV